MNTFWVLRKLSTLCITKRLQHETQQGQHRVWYLILKSLWLIHRQVDGMSCCCSFSSAAEWWIRGCCSGCHLPVFPPAPPRTDTRPSATEWRSQGATWTHTCAVCVRHWGQHVWQGEDGWGLFILPWLIFYTVHTVIGVHLLYTCVKMH